MLTPTPEQLDHYIATWRASVLTERAAAQEHFMGLCRLLGLPSPAEADPLGEWFCFEKGVKKTGGGDGWAADLSDDEILRRLLALNRERAAEG